MAGKTKMAFILLFASDFIAVYCCCVMYLYFDLKIDFLEAVRAAFLGHFFLPPP
jgi:hypothetical protein